MKKLSEVCKIVGVTRRALQEYDKIALLRPTGKTEGGYWLYDDAAIQKLILIQIFVEAGYERKAIKALFESPTLDIIEEFDHLIDTLEQKRKKIDGMINTIKTLRLSANLPESTLRAIRGIDVTRVYKDKSFTLCLKDSIAQSAEHTGADNADIEMYMPLWYNLIAIGCFIGTPEDAEQVQAAVEVAYSGVLDMINTDEDASDEESPDTELAGEFLEAIQDLICDPEISQLLELHCGDGVTNYIIRAIQVFCNNKKST